MPSNVLLQTKTRGVRNGEFKSLTRTGWKPESTKLKRLLSRRSKKRGLARSPAKKTDQSAGIGEEILYRRRVPRRAARGTRVPTMHSGTLRPPERRKRASSWRATIDSPLTYRK